MYLWLETAKGEQPLAMCVMWRPLGDWFQTPSMTMTSVCGRGCLVGGKSLEKEKNIFSVPRRYKLHYLICGSPPYAPAMPSSPPWRPNIRCHLSIKLWQTVTLLGIVRSYLNRPCIFKLLPLLISPLQLARNRGAMPNKTWLIRSWVSWFIEFDCVRLYHKCSYYSLIHL